MRLLITGGSSLRLGSVEGEEPEMTGAAAKRLEDEEQVLQRSPTGAQDFKGAAMRALTFFRHPARPRYESTVNG
jgi:hypothetical protein